MLELFNNFQLSKILKLYEKSNFPLRYSKVNEKNVECLAEPVLLNSLYVGYTVSNVFIKFYLLLI